MRGWRTTVAGLGLGLLLAACGQHAPQPSMGAGESAPWTYTAPAGTPTALSLDPGPGDNTLTNEPLLYATNGSGPIQINKSNGGNPITLNGVVYPKGIGVHANSELRYSLLNTKGATCSTFRASVGVDDEVGNSGSVVFQVLVDGVKKYDSGMMTGASTTKQVSVNITAGKTLSLLVTDAGNGNTADHADWGTPAVACTSSAKPAPGTVDAGFTTSAFADAAPGTTLTALTPEGKIIGFGITKAGTFFLRRLDQDGNLERDFNLLDTPSSPYPAGAAENLSIQSNGIIFVSGYILFAAGRPGQTNILPFLYRVSDDPARTGPVQFFGNTPNLAIGSRIAVQPDNRIVLATSVVNGLLITRLLADGSQDKSFGANGVAALSFAPNQTSAYVGNVIVQQDGKILLVGGGVFDVGLPVGRQLVIRLLPNGTLDRSFGDSGTATLATGRDGTTTISSAKILTDGSTLLAGVQSSGAGLFCTLNKITATGQNVVNFRVIPQLEAYKSNYFSPSVALQADGKIVLGGCRRDSSNSETDTIFRFNPDGSADSTFGVLAQGRTLYGANVPDSSNVLIQPPSVGNKIISGGQVLIRLWP